MLFIEVLLGCLLLAAVDAAPEYLLYTRRNGSTPQRVRPEVESLLRSSFYALDPIVVYIPRIPGEGAEHLKLIAALLEREPCNVFAVHPDEQQSNSEIVDSVSGLLIMLHCQFNVPLKQQQLVGFGAGAHLAGSVAYLVQRQLGDPLPHITALDPPDAIDALEHKLSTQDAVHVEVIHTNGQGLGTMARLGDVDYYPNGGQQQPGCKEAADPDSCSHERALELAAEMWSPVNNLLCAHCVSEEQLSASSCRWTMLRMGEGASGIYYLETRSSAPFGKGAFHISFL
ncbi:PREDICTED: lipoprotein lipase [Drosophila arizonae]|uniref:Lipoprotein lipase n=1 Tax=Drosophila arizonae TaxID=7263 RepID=A0ABM1P787_DROAR|nr:PREDICTED: lipoprotein lipase [Drosophila arizonae]